MSSQMSTAGVEDYLSRKIQELEAELAEARRREAATAEVLAVINRSRSDARPVFDTIVSSAVTLCDGLFGAVFQFDGKLLHFVAHHNCSPRALEELHRLYPARPTPSHGSGRAILNRAIVHIPDVEVDPHYQHLALTRAIGMRSGLWVPMLRDGDPIGVLVVNRAEPLPFSAGKIELLKTFADQAVVAVENARLFAGLKESLEYQTATSEVLSIISRSPAQVQPVLDAIVENAGRLCHAEYAFVYKLEKDKFQLVASNNAEAEHAKYIARYPPNLDRGSVAGRAALDRATVHVADALADSQYTRRESQRLGRYRSLLGVPLLRDGVPIGVLVLLRTEVSPFITKQI